MGGMNGVVDAREGHIFRGTTYIVQNSKEAFCSITIADRGRKVGWICKRSNSRLAKISSGGIEFILDSFFLRVCDRSAQRGLWRAGQIFYERGFPFRNNFLEACP